MVLCTATAGNLRDVDFLPLTVDVEERMYAAGKIPGSFFKREGRPSEKGILTARMIDRPIRPLFPKGWHYETQIVATPMCVDHVDPYDILAMNGASAALALSDIPFPTQMGAVRIGKLEGKFVVNPRRGRHPRVGARPDRGRHRRRDPDGRGRRQRDHRGRDPRRARDRPRRDQEALRRAARAGRRSAARRRSCSRCPRSTPGCSTRSSASHGAELDRATQVEDKLERQDATKAVEEVVLAQYAARRGRGAGDPSAAPRCSAPSTSSRRTSSGAGSPSTSAGPTAARADEIRDIWAEVGVAPRTHGSAIFTRGQTQVFTVATLGTSREEQRLDTLGLETSKRYFHHYNFPPFSVGEAGFMRGPKRRDIGHGALAERALLPMIPSLEDFPYTIRVVSDILESNGSSSMASVCGSTLSLMDAGVKIKKPVAGIAMGLIKEGDDYVVLSDIAGVEDHLGDMDFKIAGTPDGITALQMDIKITGVTFEILKDALEQAQEGRLFILGKMQETICRDARGAQPARAAHHVDPDRPREDRHRDRQGRRDDPRACPRSTRRRSTSTTTARCSSTRSTASSATPASRRSAR